MAENGYDAQYASESNNHVALESGETTTSWFRAGNIGKAWSRGFVNLGTTNPRDRASKFANASWLNVARPTRLDQAYVPHGGIGSFTFTVTAPPVDHGMAYTEYSRPSPSCAGGSRTPATATGGARTACGCSTRSIRRARRPSRSPPCPPASSPARASR